MFYVSLKDRFHNTIALLARHFGEHLIKSCLTALTKGQQIEQEVQHSELYSEPFLVASLCGLYFHQHDYIPDLFSEYNFQDHQIILMQAIAHNCQLQPYQLIPRQFMMSLCHKLTNLTIASSLQTLYDALVQTTSLATVQAKINDPLLLGLFIYLYTPFNSENQQTLLDKCPHPTTSLVTELLSASIGLQLVSSSFSHISDPVFADWQGQFGQ